MVENTPTVRAVRGPRGKSGVSIESIDLISGDHSPGSTDTYEITLSNGTSTQFTVYNGNNGTGGGGWDYTSESNPTVNTNPETYPVSWLNTTTGEEFICTDNTTDRNIWISGCGERILSSDIFGDSSCILHFPLKTSPVSYDGDDFAEYNGGTFTGKSFLGVSGSTTPKLKFSGITVGYNTTISFWVRTKATQGATVSAGGQSGNYYGVNLIDDIFIVGSGGGGSTYRRSYTTDIVYTGGWDHVCFFVGSGTSLTAYFNGVNANATYESGSATSMATADGIGLCQTPDTYVTPTMQAEYANIRVFNKAVSAAEVEALYAEGV